MAMRRTIVEEVGGLDDRIFMYGEEREFCWRVRQAGHKVQYMGDLHIAHERGATTRSIGVWREAQMQAGQLLSIRYTQGVQAARRAALAMLITHLVRLPLEFVWFGPKYTQRLQSRTIRIRNAVASIVRMPERSTQCIVQMSL
jgi:GT2 family glycosyltransferase